MRLTITPEQVQEVWRSIPAPTPRKVAARCQELYGTQPRPGEAPREVISHWTVNQWEKDKFDPEAIEARTFAMRVSRKREAAERKKFSLDNLQISTDDRIILDCGRQGMITSITMFRMIQRNAGALIKESPKETGALILAVAKSMRESADMYERAISLAERSKKIDFYDASEGAQLIPSRPADGANGADAPVPAVVDDQSTDMMESVIQAFRRQIGK